MCVRLVRMFFWVWPRTLKSKVSRRPRKNCVMTGSRVRCRRMISLVRLISSNLHRGQLWEFYKIIYSSCAKLNYLTESVTMQCRKELRAIYGSLLVPTGPLSTTQYHITPRLQLPLWTMNDDVPDPFLCSSFVRSYCIEKTQNFKTSKLRVSWNMTSQATHTAAYYFAEKWCIHIGRSSNMRTVLLLSAALSSVFVVICLVNPHSGDLPQNDPWSKIPMPKTSYFAGKRMKMYIYKTPSNVIFIQNWTCLLIISWLLPISVGRALSLHILVRSVQSIATKAFVSIKPSGSFDSHRHSPQKWTRFLSSRFIIRIWSWSTHWWSHVDTCEE